MNEFSALFDFPIFASSYTYILLCFCCLLAFVSLRWRLNNDFTVCQSHQRNWVDSWWLWFLIFVDALLLYINMKYYRFVHMYIFVYTYTLLLYGCLFFFVFFFSISSTSFFLFFLQTGGSTLYMVLVQLTLQSPYYLFSFGVTFNYVKVRLLSSTYSYLKLTDFANSVAFNSRKIFYGLLKTKNCSIYAAVSSTSS